MTVWLGFFESPCIYILQLIL